MISLPKRSITKTPPAGLQASGIDGASIPAPSLGCAAPRIFVEAGQLRRRIISWELARGLRGNLSISKKGRKSLNSGRLFKKKGRAQTIAYSGISTKRSAAIGDDRRKPKQVDREKKHEKADLGKILHPQRRRKVIARKPQLRRPSDEHLHRLPGVADTYTAGF
jgi:hypothetical protein